MAKRRTATPPQPASDEDDIEAQIDEDAAAAAPSLPLLDEGTGDDEDEAGHASLAAVPPLDESGPPTQAWHPDSMSIFSSGNDSFFGTEAGSGQHHFGPLGSDWIA
jgi:hypothetical protein